MKRKLIIGIILICCTIALVGYNEYLKNTNNMHDLVESETKEENIHTYLDATYIGGMINKEDNKGYYVVFANGFQYLVYMNNNEAMKINNYLLDHPDSSYKITGFTKLISNDLEESGKKFVKEWLDNNHHHDDEEHSHDISTDEFYHYFGYIYLDNTNNSNLLTIITYIIGITGILFIINYMNSKYHLL